MKIISKYKDYYDYMSGIHGVDEKIVLDRREFDIVEFFPSTDNFKPLSLYLCDMIYQGVYHEGKIYWGIQALEVVDDAERERFDKDKSKDYIHLPQSKHYWNSREHWVSTKPIIDKDKNNTKEQCPIMLSKKPWEGVHFKYPKLVDLNFGSILSPHDIYLILSAWLAPKDNTIDTRTNKEKVVSAGFDLKTSFRH